MFYSILDQEVDHFGKLAKHFLDNMSSEVLLRETLRVCVRAYIHRLPEGRCRPRDGRPKDGNCRPREIEKDS